jgi:hypothetical protein
MNLNDTQKQQVAKWIADGLKLADIQKRISAEFGLSLTYMDVRLLVDDLKLTPRDAAPPASEKPVLPTPGTAAAAPRKEDRTAAAKPLPGAGAMDQATGAGGNVSVTVDALARPGALVSGSVRFSDGQTATWYLDQMGRLGLLPAQQGYRPSPADLQSFQQALETELSRIGF